VNRRIANVHARITNGNPKIVFATLKLSTDTLIQLTATLKLFTATQIQATATLKLSIATQIQATETLKLFSFSLQFFHEIPDLLP